MGDGARLIYERVPLRLRRDSEHSSGYSYQRVPLKGSADAPPDDDRRAHARGWMAVTEAANRNAQGGGRRYE
jgi:hypothetical protein